MIANNDLSIIACLRRDARIKLTTLARKTGLAVSTLFERIHDLESIGVTRLCALLDFSKLGYSVHAVMLVKVSRGKRDCLREYLLGVNCVNSLMRINHDYDFLLECVFKGLRELEEFCERLESIYGVREKELHFIVEDLKREGFLGNPA